MAKIDKTVEYRVDWKDDRFNVTEWVIQECGFTTLDSAFTCADALRKDGCSTRVVRVVSTFETIAMEAPAPASPGYRDGEAK